MKSDIYKSYFCSILASKLSTLHLWQHKSHRHLKFKPNSFLCLPTISRPLYPTIFASTIHLLNRIGGNPSRPTPLPSDLIPVSRSLLIHSQNPHWPLCAPILHLPPEWHFTKAGQLLAMRGLEPSSVSPAFRIKFKPLSRVLSSWLAPPTFPPLLLLTMLRLHRPFFIF